MRSRWSYLLGAALLVGALGCGGSKDPAQPGNLPGVGPDGVDTLGLSYITPHHQGLILVRPKSILNASVTKTLLSLAPQGGNPLDQMVFMTGIDPAQVETVLMIGGVDPETIKNMSQELPIGGGQPAPGFAPPPSDGATNFPPQGGLRRAMPGLALLAAAPAEPLKEPTGLVVIHNAAPFDKAAIKQSPAMQALAEAKHGDKTYWKSSDPETPSVYFIDDSTMLMASDKEMAGLIDRPAPAGPLYTLAQTLDLNHDFVAAGVTEPFQELMKSPPGVGGMPQAQEMAEHAQQITSGVLTIDLGSAPKLQATANFKTAESAQAFQKTADEAWSSLKMMAGILLAGAAQNLPEDIDSKVVMSTINDVINSIKITQQGTSVVVAAATPSDFQQRLDKLMPGILAARDASIQQMAAQNKLKQIGLAMFFYMDSHDEQFPTDVRAADGTPLLSWRVELLPYLEQDQIYQQLKRDEPWDSPHNAQVLAQVPDIFVIGKNLGSGKTDVLQPSGNGALGGSEKPVKIGQVVDGMSNTAMAIQVTPDQAVPWAKPADYAFDPKNPAAGLAFNENGVTRVLFGDASVRDVNKSLTPEQWLVLFTYAGGEVVDFLGGFSFDSSDFDSGFPTTPPSIDPPGSAVPNPSENALPGLN